GGTPAGGRASGGTLPGHHGLDPRGVHRGDSTIGAEPSGGEESGSGSAPTRRTARRRAGAARPGQGQPYPGGQAPRVHTPTPAALPLLPRGPGRRIRDLLRAGADRRQRRPAVLRPARGGGGRPTGAAALRRLGARLPGRHGTARVGDGLAARLAGGARRGKPALTYPRVPIYINLRLVRVRAHARRPCTAWPDGFFPFPTVTTAAALTDLDRSSAPPPRGGAGRANSRNRKPGFTRKISYDPFAGADRCP